jgi:hypothetical protein
MTTDLSPESRTILEREWERLKVKDGESIARYIARHHAAADPRWRVGKGCTCPRAYSRCRYAVHYDYQREDYSQGHGGWGWPQWYGVDGR